jgi:hypothetical protein
MIQSYDMSEFWILNNNPTRSLYSVKGGIDTKKLRLS